MKDIQGNHAQRGVGLVEVMVAMLLLGVAVIGFAALQVRAVDSTHDAYYRTQGMALAQEMAERIRANGSDASLAIYRAGNAGGVSATFCFTNNCTPTQLAQFDLASIRSLAQTTLPNGQLGIVPCPGGANMCLLVSWNNTTPTAGSAATDCITSAGSYVLNAECMMMEVY